MLLCLCECEMLCKAALHSRKDRNQAYEAGKDPEEDPDFYLLILPQDPAKAHVKNRTALKLSTFLDLEKEKVYHTTHVEITGQFAEIGSFLGLRDQTQVARLHGSCCGATNS